MTNTAKETQGGTYDIVGEQEKSVVKKPEIPSKKNVDTCVEEEETRVRGLFDGGKQ